jgi:hypothetical protein
MGLGCTLLLASCDTLTGPRFVSGSFALKTINASSWPIAVPLSPNEVAVGASLTMFGDTLEFRVDGRGERRGRQRGRPSSADPEVEISYTLPFSYRVDGDRVDVWFLDCLAGKCTAAAHEKFAVRFGRGLRSQWSAETTWWFEPVGTGAP